MYINNLHIFITKLFQKFLRSFSKNNSPPSLSRRWSEHLYRIISSFTFSTSVDSCTLLPNSLSPLPLLADADCFACLCSSTQDRRTLLYQFPATTFLFHILMIRLKGREELGFMLPNTGSGAWKFRKCELMFWFFFLAVQSCKWVAFSVGNMW